MHRITQESVKFFGWPCIRGSKSLLFLKKRSKKLSRILGARWPLAARPMAKVFLLLFLQKKKNLP